MISCERKNKLQSLGKCIPTKLDIADEMYKKGFRVVAAMHRIPLGNGSFIPSYMIDNDIDECKKMWLNAFRGLTKNNKITCIAHPF